MPSNVQLNSGAGGSIATTKQISHDGDTTQCQGVHLLGISGSEDAYTAGTINGDATNGLDTDVTRVVPGTAAANLGKAEDDAHASGDVGVVALAVRRDAEAVGSGTDGDYSTLNVDANGRLRVNGSGVTQPVSDAGGSLTVDGTVTVQDGGGAISVDDNGGSITVDGSVSVGAALPAGDNNIGNIDIVTMPATFAEDAAHTTGDTGVQILAVRRDADTSLVGADNDYAPLQVNATGSLKVAITSGAGSGGTSIADGASFTRNTTSITPAGAVVEASAPTLADGDVAGLSQTTGGALRVAVAAGGIPGVLEDAAHSSGQEGILPLAVRRDANTSLVDTDGDNAPLQVDATGSLKVAIISGAGSGGTAMVDDAAFTPGTTSITPIGAMFDDVSPDSVNEGDGGVVRMSANRNLYVTLRDAAGNERGLNVDANGAIAITVASLPSHAVTNAGTFPVQVDGAALTALQLIDDIVRTDDAAFAAGTDEVAVAGFVADESSTDSVDEGDAGAARMTLDRKQIVTDYVHAAAGGESNYTALSTAAVIAAEIKGSAGKVYDIQIFNLNAAARYVRLYNQTGAPGTGDTANIVWRGIIPGNTAGAGFVVSFPKGRQFATGIGIRVTAAVADNDNTALAANEIVVNVGYA